jgi:hypothetical protein
MAIIYLTRFPECPAPWCRMRLLPEGLFPLTRKKRAGNPALCFVLHRMGFFVRSRLREDPVGAYPAVSPLPSTISCQGSFSNELKLVSQKRLILAFDLLSSLWPHTDFRPLTANGTGRFIFCDTFRYLEFTPLIPSLSRGMLPFGVRTFLWPKQIPVSDRLPLPVGYH